MAFAQGFSAQLQQLVLKGILDDADHIFCAGFLLDVFTVVFHRSFGEAKLFANLPRVQFFEKQFYDVYFPFA